MKTVIIFLLISLAGIPLMAQDSTTTAKDTIVTDALSQEPMLLGYTNRQAFQDTSFSWWFNSVYDTYNVDTVTAQNLADKLKDVTITIVMGTWCSDSRREVPRFFKILDTANYSSDSVEIICVDENLKTEGDELEGLKLKRVPTFIFYKNGNELGRIVESPKETLEKDMIKILRTHV
jgi:thiol-disulfide isomerase/thioredoxin